MWLTPMAYLKTFEHDVFISYAHVDNWTAAGDPEKGWISQFHQHFEVQLSKRIGRMGVVKIWRDRSLEPSQLFDQTIQDAIQRSAVFLALTSIGYLESDYCRQELDFFHRKAHRDGPGLSAGDRLRIFNVLLNNIPHQKWPREFGRTSGCVFHDARQEEDFGDPLDPAEKPFHQQLRALVDAAYRTLCALKEEPAETAARPVETEAAAQEFRVFLADTSDTLRVARKRLANELSQQEGIRVIANVPPPYEDAAHTAKIVAALAAADLSVHMLDEYAGREVEGTEGVSYPQKQAELATAHGKAPFIWVPQTTLAEAIEDETQRGFLDRLENGARGERHYDFVRGSPCSIAREVMEKIGQLRTAATTNAAPVPAALLDTHLKDQLHAFQLSQFLLENQVQPYINPQEDDPRKNLNLFEERLKQVGILIVFWGSVAENWVRARLGAAVQIAIAENCPLQACGVYVAPPKKKGADMQLGQRLFPVELMDHTERFDPALVSRLLERARTARA
jgi:hypothetical protein